MAKKMKSAATLTIKGAANMSAAGKRRIVRWLERQVQFFKKHSKNISPGFRARYLYTD